MAVLRADEGDAIARRYGQAAAKEWGRLLAHFDLGEGFALIVLVVPDRDGATLCYADLARLLAGRKQLLRSHRPADQDDLVRMATSLPDEGPGADIGAVWVEAAVPRSAHFAAWERGWRVMLEGLNQQRNTLRRVCHVPVVMVMAPWVVPLFRDCAPDLWSVRTQVVRIEPAPAFEREQSEEPGETELAADAATPVDMPDPEFAEREAERLRGLPDRIADRATLLVRAGIGYYDQQRVHEAEVALHTAVDLLAGLNQPLAPGTILHQLGRAIRDQGRAPEAEATFRRALALKEQDGATAVSRGNTMDMLGRALGDQGRASEAEATFRLALALKEQGGATAVSRGNTTDMLGRALRDQDRASEAEATFRLALALKEQGGATAVSRGNTMDMLGRALRDQGRASEAEAIFRLALALAEEGGASADIIERIRADLSGAAAGPEQS